MDFNVWLEAFFGAYYHRRPVNASFIGHHEYDNQLPDVSPLGRKAAVDEMHSLLASAKELDAAHLSPVQALDLKAAKGVLETQLWEYQSPHLFERNPSYYCGEAIFGVMVLFLTDYAPLAERVRAAVERMRAVPVFLAQAQQNLSNMPLAWIERALDECRGAEALFTDGMAALAAEHQIQESEFLGSAVDARRAFAAFAEFLQRELSQASALYACGPEPFDLLLHKGHFLSQSADELLAYAEAEMEKAAAYLNQHAADFGAATPEEALAGLAEIHPTAEDYVARHQQIWEACRAAALEKDLVTWPDFPIRYIPRPVWTRKAAPHLYFLFYRAPAAFNRPAVHEYLINPLPDENRPAFLRANNDSVIKLNHVVHHGSIGHHVQNWNAYHSQSRIGQVAACDTAARIAMLCGGTMAEGWACYVTDLMAEAGFLTPLEAYSEYQGRRRMCARAIVDIRLHRGEITFEEAAAYYQNNAGMGAGSARAEVTKNSMFPGGAVMYLFGRDAIYNLREELKSSVGARFNLRDFHDEFLSYGALPVTLICEDMKRKRQNAQR